MPGPKMGPRPPDFDEAVIRTSPTFRKWVKLPNGDKLRYACREFIKGHGEDEERLMRRIMIARRNNIRDHVVLKKARAALIQTTTTSDNEEEDEEDITASADEPEGQGGGTSQKKKKTKKRKAVHLLSDNEITKEMDVVAVEATRSYRKWQTLEDGQVFVYNQKYTKGEEGHDWLLRKNIWRRMRYRRENKKLVQNLKEGGQEEEVTAAGIVDHALLAANAAATTAATESAAAAEGDDSFVHKSVVEAAVAAAEQYAKAESMGVPSVHNPLEAAATDEALDAAAKLAAAAAVENDETVGEDEVAEESMEVMQV